MSDNKITDYLKDRRIWPLIIMVIVLALWISTMASTSE